ncbi:hypothetical protein [Cryobacterium sp. MDB2-10]|uniref:hypothetical protein n=1 Tax=Cryobacterium sp. MDB2-10 TaxID=1259177 RepID=UPI001100D8AC|nr:hypothetical protein [Cryobacterium sp. MDB2-10]TFC15634.1 hypothetical protein E3O51_14170 [Cryobacterium sp. MDB2-10]
MSETTNYGTVGGEDITDAVINCLVQNAEASFPGVTPRRATGRPAHQEMRHSMSQANPAAERRLLEGISSRNGINNTLRLAGA